IAQRTVPFRRVVVPGFFIGWPWRLGCTGSLAGGEEPGPRPMSPGDPLGNHGQRPIPLAVVFEPVLAHEDGMGVSAPLPHQGRAGLQHSAGTERTSAPLELPRKKPQTALQGAGWTALGALLQLIGEASDDQIATEAQRRSGVMQCPPRTPQLLCRPIDQSGNLAGFKLGQDPVSKSVVPDVDWTETGGRLATVLASRSVVKWARHPAAGSGLRCPR